MAVIRPFLIGFATTFKYLFKKPITVNYPDEKFPMFPKFRGKQVLMRDENGLEKCVACGLCSVACPADAILPEAAENDGTVEAGPRTPRSTRSTKPGASSAVTAKKRAPSARSSWARLRTGGLQQGRLRLGQSRLAGAGVNGGPSAAGQVGQVGRVGLVGQHAVD